MELINKVLDIIFPPSCEICNKIGKKYICEECEKEIKKYLYNNTKREIENKQIHLFQYTGIIREKMIQYKFNDKPYLQNFFCEILMKNKNACEFIKSYDIIIPVPIHSKRKRLRGYNQSELIVNTISKELGIDIGKNILYKNRNTKPQSLMNREERLKNVQNVYNVENKNKISNKAVIILDDIYTTGATVNECKKILLLARCKRSRHYYDCKRLKKRRKIWKI